MMNKEYLDHIEYILLDLRDALAVADIKLERILVDKTLPTKYELTTGKSYEDEPRVACNPFSTFQIAGIVIVGRDNERLRNHQEWPEVPGHWEEAYQRSKKERPDED